MSLQAVYERFLADPRSASLAPDASLIYVPTTTTFHESSAVLKHLSAQQKIVKKKSEKIIAAIQATDSLCLDVETTLEFVSGGGAYLPSLDDNFLADRVVTFPTVHIVRFDAQNQIRQIRLYWDQGSLLKQVEVIGSRGRNWPIRDAQEQIRLINSAVAGAASGKTTAPSVAAQSSNGDKSEDASRPFPPSKKPLKDPHAASSLFELLSPSQDRSQPVVPPRAAASAKPPPRDYGELFVGEDETEEAPAKNASSKKESVIAPKAGAGKNLPHPLLFGDDESAAAAAEEREQKEPRYRTHPAKFSHFELGGDNSEREIREIPTRPKSQHVSHWDFEDFTTPEKPKGKIRDQDIRHFGWSDDEGDQTQSPPPKPRATQPRRDATTHFHLQEDDLPGGGNGGRRMIGSSHNRGMALYQNNVYDEEGSPPSSGKEANAPLAVKPNGTHRKKDFDTHWSITDASPENKFNNENKRPIGNDRIKAVKMMDASWEAYDQSPEQDKVAPPPATRRGGRNVNQRSWGFGDDDF
ncbi:hypothetical protein VTN02DRAFT_1606 [Thermoascus thermophilus]